MSGFIITQKGHESKARYGNRQTCFSCENSFYDFNREIVVCPVCSVDQTERPEPKPEPETDEEGEK